MDELTFESRLSKTSLSLQSESDVVAMEYPYFVFALFDICIPLYCPLISDENILFYIEFIVSILMAVHGVRKYFALYFLKY